MATKIARPVVAFLTLALLATAAFAPLVSAAPKGGTSKGITVTAAGLTGLGDFTISAGQSVPLTITVANEGRQNINSVRLFVGQDGDPTTAENGDANPPINLPDRVTVAAPTCSGGAQLLCEIGALRARTSVSFDVVISAAEDAAAVDFATKATVKVAEGGNDAGSNLDTFSIEGSLTVLAFSCDLVAAYRPGNDKDVATPCALDDTRNANRQNAAVTLPAGLTTATLKENGNAPCPSVPGLSCIGDEVEATVEGDDPDDVIVWVIQLKGQSVTLNKLVIYHYFDDETLDVAIPLTKKNACKSASQTGCGAASMSGDVLTITIQTKGNGKTRILG